MRHIGGVVQKPGTISGATNGATVNAAQGGIIAFSLSVQIAFTGSSESGATAQLFKSNDGTSWASDGSTVAISGASGTIWLEKTNNTALYWRVQYADTTGTYVPTETWNLLV